MENSKKYSMDKKEESVQEPVSIYETEKLNPIHDKEKSIGFDMEGNPIFENEYVTDILGTLNSLAEGKLEVFSSEDVKRKILG